MKVDKRSLRIVDIETPTRHYHKAYLCWSDMFKRCYSENWLSKHPTYTDAEVCDEWLKFSVFLLWYQSNYVEGWHLDKDLFGEGKLYSPETCCFIPAYLNKFLTKRGSGVTKDGEVYVAQISTGVGKTHINKRFKTAEEARKFYAEKKMERAIYLVEKYKLDSKIRNAVIKFVNDNF